MSASETPNGSSLRTTRTVWMCLVRESSGAVLVTGPYREVDDFTDLSRGHRGSPLLS